MTEIKTNINHLKTYLGDLEVQTDNLIDNRVKSSAPKAREIAQKMKMILQELRKDIQKSALEVPVKKRVKKVEPAKAPVAEPTVEPPGAQRDEVPRGSASLVEASHRHIEQTIEPTVELPKTVKQLPDGAKPLGAPLASKGQRGSGRKTPVSEKVK